jgi:hypothetical protein
MSIGIDNIEEVSAPEKEDKKGSYSLETLTLLVNKARVEKLEKTLKDNFKILKGRQEEVKALQSLTRALNTATDNKGVLDFTNSPEIKELYLELNDRFNLKLPLGKTKFTGQERERLIENIKTAVEEKNLENDLLMHTVQQLNNERSESFQMANKILKTLYDTKLHQAQALGR